MTEAAAARHGEALAAEFARQARTRRWLRPALRGLQLLLVTAVAYCWWNGEFAWGFWPGLALFGSGLFEAAWASRDLRRLAAAVGNLGPRRQG